LVGFAELLNFCVVDSVRSCIIANEKWKEQHNPEFPAYTNKRTLMFLHHQIAVVGDDFPDRRKPFTSAVSFFFHFRGTSCKLPDFLRLGTYLPPGNQKPDFSCYFLFADFPLS